MIKLESAPEITIFGQKMMVKSGLEFFPHNFLHALNHFPFFHKKNIFAQNYKFSNKNHHLPKFRNFNKKDSRPLFAIIFRPKMVISVTDSILTLEI